VEKYDGSCKASTVELNRIHAWVQIHDLPELYRKKSIVTDLAANIGEVITIELRVDVGDFARARVWLDVRKELTRFVAINPEGQAPVVMPVKYEKVPRYCAVCGFLGHIQEECGSGVHSPGKVAFGKWMLADTAWNHSQLHANENGQSHTRTPGWGASSARGGGRMGRGSFGMGDGRGTGRGRGEVFRGGNDGGRGRGAGRGLGAQGNSNALVTADTRKRMSAVAHLTEGSLAKEGTASTQVPMLEWKEPGVVVEKADVSAQKKLEFGGEEEPRKYPVMSGTPPPPPSTREKKRPKKQTTPKKGKSNSESAGSGEELRREQ
jgi:hypothetical protein